MTEYVSLQSKYRKVVVPCEICGSSNSALLQQNGRCAEPGIYGEVPIRICRQCGFKMLNPRFEDAFYQEYYEQMYREVAFGAARPSEEYIAQQRRRGAGVLAYVEQQGVRPGRLLDHGCASGCTMLAWQDAGWDCHGVDPHRPSVETGIQLGLNVKVGAGEYLPFEDNMFDAILSLGSLEHVYDLRAAMLEARRVLKVGGLLIIRWRSNEIFASPLEYYNHNHYRFFTPATWFLALAKYGFEIVASEDRKLEGWASYSYLLARKLAELPDPGAIDGLVRAGRGDDAEAEIASLKAVRDGYFDRCSRFLALHDELGGNAEAVMKAVDERGLRWAFLGGEPQTVVARSRMEALRYLEQYRGGQVI